MANIFSGLASIALLVSAPAMAAPWQVSAVATPLTSPQQIRIVVTVADENGAPVVGLSRENVRVGFTTPWGQDYPDQDLVMGKWIEADIGLNGLNDHGHGIYILVATPKNTNAVTPILAVTLRILSRPEPTRVPNPLAARYTQRAVIVVPITR